MIKAILVAPLLVSNFFNFNNENNGNAQSKITWNTASEWKELDSSVYNEHGSNIAKYTFKTEANNAIGVHIAIKEQNNADGWITTNLTAGFDNETYKGNDISKISHTFEPRGDWHKFVFSKIHTIWLPEENFFGNSIGGRYADAINITDRTYSSYSDVYLANDNVSYSIRISDADNCMWGCDRYFTVMYRIIYINEA